MKVRVESLGNEEFERRDYRDEITITIDGKLRFGVYDGEPEDNTIARNFRDVWKVGMLMREAFNAGANGETFDLEETTTPDEE